MADILVSIRNAKKYFPIKTGRFGKHTATLNAVDDVSLDIIKGEAFGLVGESGCGKTTLGKMLVNLYQPTGGHILFEGTDLAALSPNEKRFYARDIQMIFQDPYSSLNPRMTVQKIIEEPLRVNHLMPTGQMEKEISYLLECVGLSTAYRNRYPHEFSGGQRQRIGIARAIAAKPKLIVCDEPVSALDVSAQAQILNLLVDLKKEFNLTYLFIAHGLGVVKHISDQVGVMYLGKIVEIAPKLELFNNPLHPYTQALLSVNPTIKGSGKRERILLEGDIPSPINPPPGCRFASRCPKSCGAKKEILPPLKEAGKGHFVACYLYP